MTTNITKPVSAHTAAEVSPQLFGSSFDPIEMNVRDRVREFIEVMVDISTCAKSMAGGRLIANPFVQHIGEGTAWLACRGFIVAGRQRTRACCGSGLAAPAPRCRVAAF
jgi:hypothetical protein